MKTEFFFTATSELHLSSVDGEKKSVHEGCNLRLDVSEGLNKSRYLQNDLPTKDGCHALTLTLVSAISVNIHYAHENGFRDSAEHLRYIISELERQFVQVPTISKGELNS